VADRLDPTTALYEKLWAPLAIAALNIDPGQGSARLMAAVMAGSFLRGGAACRPHVAGPDGLSAAFVDPALDWIRSHGGAIRLHHRLRRLIITDSHAAALDFGTATVTLARGDSLILALPPAQLAALLPGQPVPEGSTAILNLHFRLDRPCPLPGHAPLLGLIGGTAEWLFSRGDTLSVTVSAADRLIDRPAEDLASEIWPEVVRALELDQSQPPARVVKEKRATFVQTPDAVKQRPGTRTRWHIILLAGDWTDTGLPATIEGAIKSGHNAAQAGLCPLASVR
jgi:squalene-associated FAD-dependent desaturase